MLEPFADSLWTAEQPFRFLGIPAMARMTVVRLESGELWVHSPLRPDPPLRSALDALGPVRHIVAPSRFHYLDVSAFRAEFSKAQVWGAPRLVERHPEIGFDGTLGGEPPPPWAAEIEQAPLRGHRVLDEVAFFHRPSRALIVADLVEAVYPDAPRLTRIAGRLSGVYQRPGPPVYLKTTFRDRQAARESIERMLEWDFDRLVMSHGRPVSAGGKELFRRAYRFLLEG